MTTLVLTVPHSGTHFIVYYLAGILGLNGSRGYGTYYKGREFCQVHTHEAPDLAEFDSCLITLRHPYDSASTHKSGQGKRWDVSSFGVFWEKMIEIVPQFDTLLKVQIDGPIERRLPQMMAVAEHFGRADRSGIGSYVEAWEPRNAHRRPKKPLTDSEKEYLQFAVDAYELWQE